MAALLLASGGVASPAPSVAIVSPASGAATNADVLAVDVDFAASANDGAAQPTGNVHTVVLELDGREVAREANAPRLKDGSHRFTVALASLDEGTHVLQAIAYQGNERAGLRGASAEVRLVLDRTAPAVAITAPPDGLFVREPRVTLRGTASDALSGLAGLTCAGADVAAADSFACEPALVEGLNQLRVRAVDRAGNTAERRVSVDRFPGGLDGAPQARAVEATTDFTTERGVQPGEVSVDATGRPLARTQLEIAFGSDATVAAVNALLRSFGGEIDGMLEGVALVLVRLPDPGSIAELEALAGRLEANARVRYVRNAYVVEPDAVPANVAAAPNRVSHHLAIRAHAAWNARAALLASTQVPDFLVADFFGDGVPETPDFDVVASALDYATGATVAHGYHVTGIITGSLAGPATARGQVTGIFPARSQLRGVDQTQVTGMTTAPAIENVIVAAIKSAPGRVVLNTSFGYPCPSSSCNDEFAAQADAIAWIEKVRGTAGIPGSSVEAKFVHAKSGGNTADVPAKLMHGFNAAKLLAPLFSGGMAVANLANIVVVENRTRDAAAPYRPACLSGTASVGGDVSAIGDSVWSFTDADSSAGLLSGSSMAAPQVAGLAGYVWALNPSLSPQSVVELITKTATPPTATGCTRPVGAPVIDAYAALLGADTASRTPARTAILDAADESGNPAAGPDLLPVAGNRQFDEHDIRLFLARFAPGAVPGEFDFSRYDLNGDGRTGGPDTDRFDLDVNNLPAWTTLSRAIEGATVSFDETAVTDLQILCYYAYSPLFAGDEPVREQLLRQKCAAPVVVSVTPSTATLAPGQQIQFTATVTNTLNTSVGWGASGGTITQSGLYTAGTTTGTFAVAATSVADPTKAATATVTIADGRRGVTRLGQTNGRIATFAGTSDSRCVIIRFSHDTTWADSASCRQPAGSSDAVLEFAESHAGNELVEVAVEGTGFSAGEARSESGYVLAFQVTRPTDVVISADVAAGSCQPRVILIGASGFLVFDQDGGLVDQRFTLVPGTHQAGVGVVCSGDAGIAKFKMTLQFG